MIDTSGIDGEQQDCWIATRDKKLYEFSALSHYINIDGEAGKYATSSVLADHEHDDYWQQANSAHHFLGMSRATYHQTRDIDVMGFVGKAHKAIEEAKRVFEDS